MFTNSFLVKLDIDDRFTPENIEKAVLCSQTNDSSQSDALDFLNEWSQNPNFLITAVYIIQNSTIFNTRFISSTLIKNKIGNYWNFLESNQKNDIQYLLLKLIFSIQEEEKNQQIFHNLIESFCTLLLFELLENTKLTEIFFIQNSQNVKISLILICSFFEKVDVTDLISDLRRNDLRQFIISDLHEQIVFIISNCMLKQEFSNDVLRILNSMIRWDSIDDIVDFELFQLLASQFLLNEETCESTIKCFCSLFLERSDSEIAFSAFSPFLIDILTKGTFENQTPVTLNFKVIQFLLDFLIKYSRVLHIVLIFEDQKDHVEIERFTSETVKVLNKTMQESEFAASTLHDDLVHLYQVILSINSECIVDDLKESFWTLWNEILRDIRNEKESKSIDLKPSLMFFIPFFDEIRLSLYNSLSSVFCEENDLDFSEVKNVLTSIYSIEKDGYIDFLIEQPPSPQLCISLVAFEFADKNSQLEKVTLTIDELLQHSNGDQSPEFQSALLFGLSHCSCFFSVNGQLFSQIIEYIFDSIASSENIVAKEASFAFQRIVGQHPELFKRDLQLYIECVIGQSEELLLNLDPKVAKRFFKSCTRLILQADEKEVVNMICHFFEPVVAVLKEPEKHGQIYIETALDVISKSFNFLCVFSSELFEFFWKPLFQLTACVMADLESPTAIIEKALFAAVNIQLNFEYDQIKTQIDELFELMKSRGKVEDFFFMYFSYIRSIYDEVDSMYIVLFEELVVPYLKSEETAPTEMFFMVGEFSPTVVNIEWFCEIVIQTLRNLGTDVCEAALESLSKIISGFSSEQKVDFLYHMSPQILYAFIEFVVDLLHKPLFARLVDVLYQIVFLIDLKSTEDFKKLQDLMKEAIVSSLKKFAEEPQEDFFLNFADYLLGINNSKTEFKSAFSNLLFAIKKASPCDLEIFKNAQISKIKIKLPDRIRNKIK